MNEERKDFKAAHAECRALFNDLYKHKKKEVVARLLKGFTQGYAWEKAQLVAARSPLEFTWAVQSGIKQAQASLAFAVLRGSGDPDRILLKVEFLGKSFGLLLETIEEGFTDSRGDTRVIAQEVIPVCKAMIQWLQPMYTEPKPGAMRKRIEDIARTRGKTQREDQKQLLLNTAAIFPA